MSDHAIREYLKTIEHGGGGVVSITSYNDLTDKPQIEGVTLSGNKTFSDLNLDTLTNLEIQAILDDGGWDDDPVVRVTSYNELVDKPSIEGVALEGNKTFPNLNLNILSNSEIQDIFDNLI